MSATRKTAVLVGLHPDAADHGQWPVLTRAALLGAIEADRGSFARVGIEAELCFVDPSHDAPGAMRAALERRAFDFVLIGAGVRTNPEHLLLFETLVNLAHRLAPQARLCFNTGPTDSLAAVQRWR